MLCSSKIIKYINFLDFRVTFDSSILFRHVRDANDSQRSMAQGGSGRKLPYILHSVSFGFISGLVTRVSGVLIISRIEKSTRIHRLFRHARLKKVGSI